MIRHNMTVNAICKHVIERAGACFFSIGRRVLIGLCFFNRVET